jgi:hypothetical protein
MRYACATPRALLTLLMPGALLTLLMPGALLTPGALLRFHSRGTVAR